MPARNRMVHRAAVSRAGESDPFDTFAAPPDDVDVYGAAALLPCYVQPKMERTLAETGRFFAHATYRMLAPLGSNLQEEDRITEVVNKRGIVLFEDVLRVAALVKREGQLEAVLESYA